MNEFSTYIVVDQDPQVPVVGLLVKSNLNNTIREVLEVDQYCVTWRKRTGNGPYRQCSSLANWRTWTRNGKVVRLPLPDELPLTELLSLCDWQVAVHKAGKKLCRAVDEHDLLPSIPSNVAVKEALAEWRLAVQAMKEEIARRDVWMGHSGE